MIVQLDTIYVNVMWRCHFKNDRKQWFNLLVLFDNRDYT